MCGQRRVVGAELELGSREVPGQGLDARALDRRRYGVDARSELSEHLPLTLRFLAGTDEVALHGVDLGEDGRG